MKLILKYLLLACLSELPKDIINYYIEFIKEKCKEFYDIDYTLFCNFEYLDDKLKNIVILL